MALHRAGREAEADSHYARVLDAEPRHAQALRLRGILARETGHPDLSIELLRQAVELAAQDAEPAAELGLSLLANGQLHLAEAAFRQALERDPASLKPLANLGAVLQHRGHLAQAIAVYREALAVAPGDVEVRCNLAQALLEAGRGDEGLAECDEALAMVPEQPVELVTVRATRGSILCSLGRHAEALPVLEAAVESGMEWPQAESADMPLVNLALAWRELGFDDRAMDTLVMAVNANPDNARAVADLAWLCSANGQCERALGISADFLARHPGERLVLAARAAAWREAGREQEAGALIDLQGLVVIRDLAPAAQHDAAGLNHDLAALVRNDPSLLASPASKSTRGGAQTGEFDPLREPVISRFQELVNAEIRGIIADLNGAGFAGHPVMDWAAGSWTLRMWGNVLEAGGGQLPHIHPLGWLSGVYYPEVPAAIAGTADGALEFGGLPAWTRLRQPPERRIITPLPGRLVVFPSFFHHCTLPFDAAGEQRISIAFDVMPACNG